MAEWQPLGTSKKAKIDGFFDEKVTFLAGRGCLDARIAEPLKYLHRYRNEAYHRAKVRPETIRTAALILLEINCQLVLSLHSCGSYASDEDYSWIEERFGKRPFDIMMDGAPVRKEIIDQIRSAVLPTDASVASTLAKHLESRLEDLEGALGFVTECLESVPDREAALKLSQYNAECERGQVQPSEYSPVAFTPRWTVKSIEQLRDRVPEIRGATDRLDAFHRFSLLEVELEPIESCVHKFASKVQDMIQMEIDIRRGK